MQEQRVLSYQLHWGFGKYCCYKYYSCILVITTTIDMTNTLSIPETITLTRHTNSTGKTIIDTIMFRYMMSARAGVQAR